MMETTEKSLINQYRKHGYIVVKLFDIAELNAIKSTIMSFLFGNEYVDGSEDEPFDKSRQILAQEYSIHLEGGALKRKIRLLSQLPNIVGAAGNPSIFRLLSELGLNIPVVSSNPEFRTDFPQDEKYMQPWHQDWLYSQTSLNSVTIWTPLHDTNLEDGALMVRPGSHDSGVEDFVLHMNPRKFEVKNSSPIVEEKLPIKFGESILFSQLLQHKSGLNISDKVRLSFQLRYADAGDDEWIKSQYYKADKNVTQKRKLYLP